MKIFRNAFTLIGAFVLATACGTFQEKQVFSDWNQEARKWSRSETEEVRLPELDESASLDDYVLYAMLNNPGLRAAFDRWKAALDQVGPAQTLPDPRFTYANYIREVETRVGAQEQKFGLAQTFPWFGTLDLRGDMALQAANAEQQRYEAAKLDLIYRVKNIYYEVGYLAEAIAITKDNLTLLTYLEGVARTKYKSGAGLQSAVIKAQVELGKLEDRLHSLEDLMRPMVTKLNMALNRPSNMPLPVPKGLPEEKQAFVDEDLFFQLRKNNPNLKAFDYMASKEDLAI